MDTSNTGSASQQSVGIAPDLAAILGEIELPGQTEKVALKLFEVSEKDRSKPFQRDWYDDEGWHNFMTDYHRTSRWALVVGTEAAGQFKGGSKSIDFPDGVQTSPLTREIAGQLKERLHLDYDPTIYRGLVFSEQFRAR